MHNVISIHIGEEKPNITDQKKYLANQLSSL